MAHIYHPPPQPTQARTLLVQGGDWRAPDDPPFSSRTLLSLILRSWRPEPAWYEAIRALQARHLRILAGDYLPDYAHTLEFAPLINGGRFVYAHTLSVLQAAFPDYVHHLVAVAALPDYAHTLRSVPALDPLFSDDVQRTYAEAELV